MKVYSANLGLWIKVRWNSTKFLEWEDVPELCKWLDERDPHFIDDVKFKTTRPPVPPFPKSEDYFQFCSVMQASRDSETVLMAFKELFDLDSEDNITGASMVFSGGELRSALSDGYRTDVEMSFQAVRQEDWSTKYNRISPWVKDVLRDIGPRSEDDDPLELSPYDTPASMIAASFDTGSNTFYYGEDLVREAIKHNFPEGDPDRTLLMESTEVAPAKPPTETLRWYLHWYDYSRTFDPVVLAKLRPGLLAYLRDLKNLAGTTTTRRLPTHGVRIL